MIDRVTVPEAALRLGISEGALRQRIHRDTIRHERDEEGRVYVYLTSEDTQNNRQENTVHDIVQYELVEELRDRIRFLETELEDRKEEARRKDSIIMSLTQRVPELEAVSEQRESPVSDSKDPAKGSVPKDSTEGEIRPSWWQRLFG